MYTQRIQTLQIVTQNWCFCCCVSVLI